MSNRKLRCAIYTRKSTTMGLEQEFNTLDAQREACEAYILSQRHNGWELVPERYDDGGFTGANLERPAFQRLMDDMDAGKVDILAFTAADDFGNVINPMIVAGQVHGGVAQGIGQALLENTVYDENGQLLTGSFMDYAMPRASDVPFYDVDHSCQTPCTHNPLGVKGCGEAGVSGSLPSTRPRSLP